MKNTILILTVLFTCASATFAQGYQKDSKVVNAGIGFGLAGIYGDAGMPPISVGLQYGIDEKISVGGLVGFSTSSYSAFDWKWSYTYIIIGARGEYHFLEPSNKLDAYAGLTLGYDIVSVSTPSDYFGGYATGDSYLVYGVHAGARYAITDKVGVFGELGYGMGYLTVGATFKL